MVGLNILQNPLKISKILLYLLYVCLRYLRQRKENSALQAVALVEQGLVINLDTPIALSAARLGLEFKLPLADSVILATARTNDAIIWTQDADFKSIPGVKFVPKRK